MMSGFCLDGRRSILTAILVAMCLTTGTRSALAQFAIGGVYVDPQGMLKETSRLSPDERLQLLRKEAVDGPAVSALHGAVPLRKISLKRLEQRVAELHQAHQPLPSDVRFLAGVSRVQYVFLDPAAGDVILAGPAEGWKQLPGGEVVGQKSGQPVLHLDDLLVALRFAFAEQRPDGFLGCSINPTEEGMTSYARYVSGLRTIDRSRVAEIATGMEEAMGPQAVSVYGIDGESRFALAMVAADYRLKRLAMGHDPSPVKKVSSFLDLASHASSGSGRQPQHRWWFVAQYDSIRHTPDRLGYEFVGPGVKVQTAAQKTQLNPRNDPQPSGSAKRFAEQATQNFTALAARIPVFGELQNLVSLAVAAELVHQQSGDEKSAWRPRHFLDHDACPTARHPVPKQVPSLANLRQVRNRSWMFSVSGGVEISPVTMLSADHLQTAPPTLAETRKQSLPASAPASWWWD